MTFIMHEIYGYTPMGAGRFVLNRVLRLYPAYLMILLLSGVAIMVVGESRANAFNSAMRLPVDFTELLQNLTMVYWSILPNEVKPRLSPATWALTVELLYYFLIAIGISRTRHRTWIWFVLGLGYAVWVRLADYGYAYSYYSVLAGSLPFSLGALMYHYRSSLNKLFSCSYWQATAWGLLALHYGCWIVSTKIFKMGIYYHAGPYINMLVQMFVVAVLMQSKPSEAMKNIDKRVGDWSYPIYLMHWPVGMLLSYIVWGQDVHGLSVQGGLLSACCLLVCILLAQGLVVSVDQPVQRLRSRLKGVQRVTQGNVLS